MNKLCSWYERCEGYDWPYVWFHKPVYKGHAYDMAVLWVFSGEVKFYDTWDDYMNGVVHSVDRVYPVVTREKKWDDGVKGYVNYSWRITYAHGYTRVLSKGEWEAYRIQRAWRRCISDPGYMVCRRRLEREFDGM